MKKLSLFVAGLLVALSFGALAIQSGGFPYFPIFGHVTVNGAGSNIDSCSTAGAANNKCFAAYTTANGFTYEIDPETDAKVHGHPGLQIIRNSGLSTLSTIRIGNATDAPTILMNGAQYIPSPKISFGEFNANSGGCANNSGVWQTQNMGGTCTRNSAGVYTILFTTAYAGAPICMANATSSIVGVASVNTAGTTSVTVGTSNTSFVASDIGAFFVSCIGF